MNLPWSQDNFAGLSDRDALRRVAKGDVAAIGHVYDRHAASLLQFAARLVGRSDAEDVVQTVFIRAARLSGTYDGRLPSARSWLLGITHHVMQERRRSIGRTIRAMLRLNSTRPPAQVPSIGDRRDIERGLSALSEVQRVVLLLSDVEGFGGDEIASMLSIPVGTVWTRLHHARRKFRAFLSEGG
jgi:RNA polymerase sigma-70 factor, ECF subfamily